MAIAKMSSLQHTGIYCLMRQLPKTAKSFTYFMQLLVQIETCCVNIKVEMEGFIKWTVLVSCL